MRLGTRCSCAAGCAPALRAAVIDAEGGAESSEAPSGAGAHPQPTVRLRLADPPHPAHRADGAATPQPDAAADAAAVGELPVPRFAAPSRPARDTDHAAALPAEVPRRVGRLERGGGRGRGGNAGETAANAVASRSRGADSEARAIRDRGVSRTGIASEAQCLRPDAFEARRKRRRRRCDPKTCTAAARSAPPNALRSVGQAPGRPAVRYAAGQGPGHLD
jgi:hypothetical protein